MTQTIKYTFALLIAAAALALLSYSVLPASASIESSEAYRAYSVRAPQVGTTTLKAAPGVIGSVVVSSTTPTQATTTLFFYDTAGTGTSTTATTTFLFSVSGATAGTFQYDVEYTRGLLVETTAGFNGNLVITYK